MSSTEGLAILTAKAVGIFATGWASAVAVTNHARLQPLYTSGKLDAPGPGSDQVQLTNSHRLAIWHTQFNSGARVIIPLVLSSSGALATAGALLGPSPSSSWIPVIGDRMWFYWAAGLAAAFIPHTILNILPVSTSLIQMRFASFLDKSADAETSTDEVLMEEQLAAWNRLHGVRSILLTTAFVMAIAGSVY